MKTLRQMKVQHDHDKLVDEVVTNNMQQVREVLGPLLKDKVTSSTIESTEEQMQKRILTNTYQLKRK
jgi:hypothetical protein